MNIDTFLLDRIAEDEAVAQAPHPSAHPDLLADMSRIEYDYGPIGYALIGIGRVLVECEAKRRIIESYAAAKDCAEDEEWTTGYADGLHEAITILAQAHSDHPDFDPAWRLP